MKNNCLFLIIILIFSVGCSNTAQDFECFWRGACDDSTSSTDDSSAEQNSIEETSCTVAGIENSSETSEFTIADGESDSVTCNAGYTKSGSIYCSNTEATGTVTCTPIGDCLVTGGIANSSHSITFSISNGGSDSVTCDAGYTRSVVGAVTCSEGNLSDTLTCDANPCIATEDSNSDDYSAAGSITGNTGDVVTVTCSVGYEGGEYTCGSDGNFTGSVCTLKTCTLDAITNSNHTSSTIITHGDPGFEVNCNEGYRDSAVSQSFTCNDGVIAETLTCSIQTYNASIDNLASFGGDTSGSITLNYGDTVAKDDVTCNAGYKSNLTSEGSTVVSDGADGVKLDPEVNCSAQEWAFQYHGNNIFANPGGGFWDFTYSDYTNNFAADKDGNIYAFGSRSINPPPAFNDGSFDGLIIKINGEGEVLWEKHITQAFADDILKDPNEVINDVSADEYFRAATVDDEQNIYFTIETSSSMAAGATVQGKDCAVAKMNKDGELLWITQLDNNSEGVINDSSGNDFCMSIAVTGSGENLVVYVGGNTMSGLGLALQNGQSDGFVAKLNYLGAIQWVKHVTETVVASTAAKCNSVDINSSGEVICGGQIFNGAVSGKTNSGTTTDAFAVKFSSAGVEDTTNNYQLGQSGKQTYINHLQIDSSDNVYAVGKTTGSLEGTNGGDYDGFIVKLSSSLSQTNLEQINFNNAADDTGAASGTESCRRVALDAAEKPIALCYSTGAMAGATNGSSTKLPVLIKFSTALAHEWRKQYDDSTSYIDSVVQDVMQDYDEWLGSGLTINPDGSIYFGSVIQASGFGFADNDGSAKSSGADSDPWIMKVQETVGTLAPNP